jgi:hypothetical protein
MAIKNPSDDDQSIKLVAFIRKNETKSPEEVSKKIQKYIDKSADVNFKDANHGENTALHFAVEKQNVQSVKLLLNLRPNLSIKNKKNKTAKDLAKKLNNEDILELFSTISNVTEIDEKFIHEIDFSSFTEELTERLKLDPTFKILKFINGPSIDFISSEFFSSFIQASTHLFVIIFQTDDDINSEALTEILRIERPLMIQIAQSSGESKIICKPKSRIENFAIKEKLKCFDIKALDDESVEQFSGNLLNIKLDLDESKQLLINAAEKGKSLTIRFINLFKIDFENEEIPLVESLNCQQFESFLSVLDLPFQEAEAEPMLDQKQREMLEKVDRDGNDILKIATEKNDVEVVKFLAKQIEKSASNFAWELKRFECLLELIKADHEFPESFRLEDIKNGFQEKFKEIVNERENFHEAIKIGSISKVHEFMQKNPQIKHGYDTKNFSALTLALKKNQFKIYALLRSEGFKPGKVDDYEESLQKLSESEKSQITKFNRDYFGRDDSTHLMYIMSKVRFGFNTKDCKASYDVIRKMLAELNEISMVQPILKLMEISDDLQIVFDFDRQNVQDLDPTAGNSTTGKAYHRLGYIYVAAANYENKFYDIIGTFAHELTHYAMQLIYENQCKPYTVNEETNDGKFDEITTKVHKSVEDSKNWIIRTVFRCYPREVWHAELIVRIPHLFAVYKNNPYHLEQLIENENCVELKEYFEEIVLKDIENHCNLYKVKKEIENINMMCGLLTKIAESGFGLVQTKINEYDKLLFKTTDVMRIVKTNSPTLTITAIHQKLYKTDQENVKSTHMFVNMKSFLNSDSSEKIKIAFLAKTESFLVVDCEDESENFEEIKEKFVISFGQTERIFMIVSANDAKKISDDSSFNLIDVNHAWNDLDKKTKQKLLRQEVNFQGHNVKLSNLLTFDSPICNYLPLNDLIRNKSFEIGEPLNLKESENELLIERNIVMKKYSESGKKNIENGEKKKEEQGKIVSETLTNE